MGEILNPNNLTKKNKEKKKGEKYWLEQNQNKLTKPTLLLEKIFFKFYVIGLLVFSKWNTV